MSKIDVFVKYYCKHHFVEIITPTAYVHSELRHPAGRVRHIKRHKNLIYCRCKWKCDYTNRRFTEQLTKEKSCAWKRKLQPKANWGKHGDFMPHRERWHCSVYKEKERDFMKPMLAMRHELSTWLPDLSVSTKYLIPDGRNKYSVLFDLIGE